jgi:hypothetical protein
MSNTSATGGFLLPAAPAPLPGTLTFEQFLVSVFAGISGLATADPTYGGLVRPKWQPDAPPSPPLEVDWLAIGPQEVDADFDPFQSIDAEGNNLFQTQTDITINCSFYGPNAFSYVGITRDGFKVAQNRELLQSALMDFVSASKAVRAPDLINERWVNRWEMSIRLRREILRVYPILNFLSSSGSLLADASSGVKTVAINAQA